jgi:beta-glucosidase
MNAHNPVTRQSRPSNFGRPERPLLRFLLVPVASLLLAVGPAGAQTTPAYRDASLSIDARVSDLLDRMTLREKFWQLYMSPGSLDDPSHDYSNGAFGLQIDVQPNAAVEATPEVAALIARTHAERINSIQRYFVEETRLGIPIIPFDEALHGLAREGATSFPQAIALAATWDTVLVSRVALAIAREVRSRGIRDVLSPVVNIATDVRWGRVEETYGEDPLLVTSIGGAFIRAFENDGIITTPKHLVANVGDGGRDSYPIEVSRRLIEEVHFPPFRSAIVDAGARSVMTAYNSVDGLPATQNDWLMNGKVKRDWGFAGFIISDAAATGGATVLHMTEPNTPTATQHAFVSGLDVVFQSSWPQHRPYLEAFERGMISDSIIDASVTRVLRAKFELGLFEDPYVDVDSAAYWNGNVAHRELAREAARASIVLLRNEGSLPISLGIGSVAVIGSDATEARLGGYSGPGIGKVSILDGIRRRLGDAAVSFAPGPGRITPTHAVVPAAHLSSDSGGIVVPGLRGEYWPNNSFDGHPLIVRRDARLDFRWTLSSPGRGIPYDWYSVRWTGTLTVPAGGASRLGIEANDGYRLWLDGELLIDNWRKQSYSERLAEVSLEPGRSYDLRVDYFESTGNAWVKLVWDAGVDADWRARIDEAVAIARTADVAIVVAGVEEGEFRDRAYLSLPGHQSELIRDVAATGTPVVVVTIGGSAITMSDWIDSVDAVVHAWYPGEEGGNAVADVVFGDYSPAGRLPVTFPVAEGQLPLVYNHKPTGRGDDYVDLTGQPAFPFGFGLSYTTFEYSDLVIEPAGIGAGGSVTVRCVVRNTGDVAGGEVVQLYIRDILASVARPIMQLAGFRRIHLEPGERRAIEFRLTADDLTMLDESMRTVLEPGTFRIMIGASSKDIRLRGELEAR